MSEALRPGESIDRYVVETVLGVGNMATVYGVRHATLDQQRAVKLLHSSDKGVQERLVREGRVQAALSHPNVVRVEDVFMHNGAPALLMERIDGPDLYQFLYGYRPSLDEALALFGGILSGVRAAHEQAVTHRDLKPANILLHINKDGSVVPKVLDFGLAKALDPRGTNKTTAGLPLGTPWYMAPEQIQDASSADQRADIFSLSAILYELVTGTICFEDPDALEVYRKVLQGLYAPPRDYVPDLPYHVATAIEYGLLTDVGQRTQDCDALGRALWKNATWPTRLEAGTAGAAHAAQLHQQYESQRQASAAASSGPGLSSRGSGELLQAMVADASNPPPAQGGSWLPYVSLAVAALLLLTTVAVAVAAVGAVAWLN